MAWALGHHLVAWPGGVTGLSSVPEQERSPLRVDQMFQVPQPGLERKPGVGGDRAELG